MDSTVVKHIEATPNICGGKPRIAGTRICVQDIYLWHELHSLSADEIVDAYPHLTLADVYAALAYYHDHCDDIHHDIEAGRVLAESLKKHYPAKLQQKLRGSHVADDSVSS
ncbi:MAG: DUF433 domain-containing protein [Candidatus Tectomicrobia bacterium]|nr:DUF433 domain-containing protein [Candidatus Tectomicrobia bacterium]